MIEEKTKVLTRENHSGILLYMKEYRRCFVCEARWSGMNLEHAAECALIKNDEKAP